MATHTLAAEPRTILGKQVKRLRQAGKTPATLYGPGLPSQSLQVESHALRLLLRELPEGAPLVLTIGTKRQQVVLQDVQWDPLTDQPLHVDFYQPAPAAQRAAAR
ncbi:MAG: hypothetical protein K6U89_17880 [Chloroflexi bacterium]|nr:hypothetical protein [Chloroflexota bacterium]GIW12140.1 MAG: hypothetical protein KatS3mg061_3197 [Dehalococcoidia bacterium]